MGEQTPPKSPEPNPAPDPKVGELILALQNRINSFEAKLQEIDLERKNFSGLDRKTYDDQMAIVKAELAESRKELGELKKAREVQGGNPSERKRKIIELVKEIFSDEWDD